MFLFLQFILDNVRPYADVHALCLTSTESIEFMTRYYRCVKPMALPFPRFRLKQKGASAWDKFTNYFLSKPVFRAPSELRMRLCILLDFMKASHHPLAAMPDPRDIIISMDGFRYFRRRMRKICDDTWFAITMDSKKPRFFRMSTLDRSCDSELHCIVFTELEYMSQFDIYFEKNTNAIYEFTPYIYIQKVHVVQTLGCTYVIVVLCKHSCSEANSPANKIVQARFDICIADGADVHHERTSTDIEAFARRFHTK